MKIDPRFLKTTGVEAFTGNELLVKGALEAGVGLITGYPGSPVSDVFDVVHEIAPYLGERGVVAQIANNEALSAARLNGARQAGLRAMAVMKSVGLHVASDALAIGNLAENNKPQGGAIVVVGDDPWNETTQINSDSRYISKHMHMPIIEPSTFQELKDWVNHALDLSGHSDLYLTYLLTTNQADGGGTVHVNPHPEMAISERQKATLSSAAIEISKHVLIPPHTSWREATLEDRMTRLLTRARELNLNIWLGPRKVRKPVGFITAGLSYSYLEEVLKMLGLWNELPVLKLGITYPLDQEAIREMARSVEHLVVVEEKRGFLEGQIAEIMISLHQAGRLAKPPSLWGKKFPDNEKGFPETRGLNVSILLEVLAPAFMRWKEYFPTLDKELIEKELAEILHTRSSSYDVPTRTPTFCPGCPHRDSATVSLKLKKNLMKESTDVIFHGESGCHSMLQFAPNEGLMQNYSGMGLGGGTGAGMAPFITNKQMVFLGDSTFFHSGIVAVSDSVKNNQDITYVILENGTTAMTGHQPTPGNDVDVMGRATMSQDIERVLRGMIPEGLTLIKTDPSDRVAYEKLLESSVQKPGVKVIIADKECAITLYRRKNEEKKLVIKEVGYLPSEEKINITPEVCEYCLECTRQTACPGLTVEETPYGRKIATDLSTCVDDGACSRTKACPSFEKVVITRAGAPKEKDPMIFNEAEIPEPRLQPIEGRWSAYTAAVGGMGAGVVNAVLVRAGMKQGYEVSFLDKKGLAIRNGGVYGHVVFSNEGPIRSPVIPYGKADLLVGLDLLEAARALDARTNLRVAHPARTHGIVNNHKNETVLSLMGREDFDPQKLEDVIQAKIRLGGFLSSDFSELSEHHIGSKLYANMMIIGAAYQKGWLPVSKENLLAAIDESVRKSDIQANHHAFHLGRYLALKPELLHPEHRRQTLAAVVHEKSRLLERTALFNGSKRSAQYRKVVEEAVRWMELPSETTVLLARTIYDLVRYGGFALARRYVALVWATYKKDQKRFGFRATRAVAEQLFRLMAIKDEVWVAQLLTSPEKYQRDLARYKINLEQGDTIRYLHLNRPCFTVFGRDIEFDLNTKDWMLRIMARMGFLRKILPGWHVKEKAFRDWYTWLIDGFNYYESEEDYNAYVSALAAPALAKGYREIRYPLMEKAKQVAAEKLASIKQHKENDERIQNPESAHGGRARDSQSSQFLR